MNDLFGIAFHDYLKGERKNYFRVWINGQEQDPLPVAYFFRTFSRMPIHEKLVLGNCRGRILDVGAGAGAHALVLSKRGLHVTAIDASPGAVEAMQARGLNAIRTGFMDFSGGVFDSILFLMNGIGMAEKIKRLPALLSHARRLLAPGGAIFLESTDLLYMFEQADGSLLLPMHTGYYGETRFMMTYKNKKARPFAWLYVDYDNLSHLSDQSGLKAEMIWHGRTHNYIARLTHRI